MNDQDWLNIALAKMHSGQWFGFNSKDELQYRGRLEASQQQLIPNSPKELLEAMLQVAKTGNGPQEQIPSIGCSIKWKS